MTRTVVVAAWSALLAGSAMAHAEEPDLARGAALAADTCAQCHDVTAEGGRQTWPPSFASIAWFRSDEIVRSRIQFPQLHGPMPQFAFWLPPEDVAALVAYIRSLEPREN